MPDDDRIRELEAERLGSVPATGTTEESTTPDSSSGTEDLSTTAPSTEVVDDGA